MIIDVHTHIFPRSVREDRDRYLSAEPAFELLYGPPDSKLAGADDIVRTMDAQGVDRSVVFGFPWETPDTFEMHNDYILEAVARHPTRLVGFGCFDPLSPDAARETERCINAGLQGIGELAFYQSGIDVPALDRLEPVMAMLSDADLPALIHTNEPIGHMYPGKSDITLRQIEGLVKRFPDNRIILAHWGGGILFFHLLKKEMKNHLANVYFDTAASPFLYDPQIYSIAAGIVGTHKILFGSDYPLINPKRYFSEMAASGLPEDDVRDICGPNAQALLKV